jgi:S1-C subfamily serine protease
MEVLMRRSVLVALAVAIVLPSLAAAVPRPPELRRHPRDISELPSFVRRVEPALLAVKVRAAAEAPSSARLGAERFATGIVFDERGYAVTVSYAVLDALRITAQTRDGRTLPARLVAVDLDSGLGVIQVEGEGPWPAAVLGDSRDVAPGDLTGTVGVDEDNELVQVAGTLRSVRRFSAYWEYMLERALFVAPSSPSWGGSAVVDSRGRVIGIASLRLGEPPHVNLAIPVEKLAEVKDELIAAGRVVSRRPRPWLGLYTIASEGQVLVDGFAASGPAQSAGFRKGDRIVGVNGVRVASQEEFYEQLWRGRAGDVVLVAVQREQEVRVISVRSVDRQRLLAPAR